MTKQKAKRGPAKKGLFTKQQMAFVVAFCSPNTDTFQNVHRSALKAGYSASYAKNITTKDTQWISDLMGVIVGEPTDKKNLVAKAKKVLDDSLTDEDHKIRQDTAKFIVATTDEFSKKADIKSDGKAIAPTVMVKWAEPLEDGDGESDS